ncbi:hypothetical protein WA1_35450 [Scytonema hofmannii PCC 7110]|uniref:Uncharacterized protein n=1 Tax=Scytonema hofmannii PCC 7110 TaxID=128403 RepID=A0A139X1C5_9CYAN|nr:hypothetical protein [Scytonema hofmannii]KYC38488.1 hypothetical protein WA1_35450 [Scytonema hofmannii PCC 7110]
MLLSVNIPKTPSTELLLKLWAERYTVDVSSLSKNPKFYGELVKAAWPEARALTAAKLLKTVLERTSYQAVLQAKSLYEYIPDIIDSQAEQRITQFACKVYQTLLSFYQQQSGIVVTPIVKQMTSGNTEETTLVLRTIPSIEKLFNELEQSLLKYQEQHFIAKEQRVLGFLTTLFNFTNQLLINQLTPAEKVLLCPYFKFLEEQVAMPWQRVCAAAAKHQLGSPALALVQQMFPIANEISSIVYCRLLQLLPNYRSLRGSLGHPDVAHSCLRDLDMFQAYLWLCVLEESLRPMEQELVPLCVMVMPSVGVKWEMTNQWKRQLVDEIESRVPPEQKPLLLNYTQGMESAFFAARQRLGHPGDIIEIPSEFGDNLIIHINSQSSFS